MVWTLFSPWFRSGYYGTFWCLLDNFFKYFLPQRGTLSDGREGLLFHLASGDRPFPMVALEDIAWFAAHLLENPGEWGGRTLPIMSESLTISEVARTFERVTGIPAEHRDVPLDEVRAGVPVGHDIANMYRFVQEIGWTRDYEALRKIHPGLRTFEAWLKETGWRGEPREVQKVSATSEPATAQQE